ncbi:MAG: hypothetical protein ACWGQW_04250 [bacterium]
MNVTTAVIFAVVGVLLVAGGFTCGMLLPLEVGLVLNILLSFAGGLCFGRGLAIMFWS